MIRLTRKRLVLGGIALLVLALVVYAFLPRPVPVQTALVERAPLQVLVEEEGTTEVADRYAVTAPVAAYLRRIELEEGDVIQPGTPVAYLEPPRTPVLDPASRQQAQARVRAATAAAERAETERARVQRLFEAEAATQQQLEQAVSEAQRTAAELEAARAALRGTEGNASLGAAQTLRSPVGGRVLAVRRRSAGQVNPGDTLVVVGNTGQLEVRADVLSQDAVRITPGTRVVLDQWGGDTVLHAAVRRVDPQGYTSVSSLGVEEQRVPVTAVIESPPELWAARLGAGYRVLARFVVWESPAVLQVPSAALFRMGDEWAVFVVENGRAQRRIVQVGEEAGLATQVTAGLEPGDVVIVHPGNEIEDGTRVEASAEQG